MALTRLPAEIASHNKYLLVSVHLLAIPQAAASDGLALESVVKAGNRPAMPRSFSRLCE